MILNKNVVIAINAVKALRKSNASVRVEDLAVSLNESSDFLQQIVRKLRIAEILVVKRGPGGGVIINPEYTTISAHAVACAVDTSYRKLYSSIEYDGLSAVDTLKRSICGAFMDSTI